MEFKLSADFPEYSPHPGDQAVKRDDSLCVSLRDRYVAAGRRATVANRDNKIPEFLSDFELLETLEGLNPFTMNDAQRTAKPACAACHSSTAQMYGAPHLPIEDLSRLAKYRNGRAMQLLRTWNMPLEGHRQMILSDLDRAQLIHFLEGIYKADFVEQFVRGHESDLRVEK